MGARLPALSGTIAGRVHVFVHVAPAAGIRNAGRGEAQHESVCNQFRGNLPRFPCCEGTIQRRKWRECGGVSIVCERDRHNAAKVQ